MTARIRGQRTEKLQKVLARAGLGSRRRIEEWIAAGRVSVNGSAAELGARVGPADVIRVDGRRVGTRPVRRRVRPPRVLCYNKPVGEVCTRADAQGRPTAFARLPGLKQGRWVSVGRLDVNTSGLLLFTNEGELAHRLMHPSSALEREYAVRVFGEVTPEAMQRLQRGVALEDGVARFEDVRYVGGEGLNRWYHVTLTEGRKRVVRRLWESQGVRVSRLIRVRYGPVALPRALRQGRWQELPQAQVAQLASAVGLEAVAPTPEPARRRRRAGGR